jgi:hypothetical protein
MLSFVVPPRALTRAVQAAAFVRNVVSVILCFPYNDGKLEDSTDFHQKLGDVDWSKDGPLTLPSHDGAADSHFVPTRSSFRCSSNVLQISVS